MACVLGWLKRGVRSLVRALKLLKVDQTNDLEAIAAVPLESVLIFALSLAPRLLGRFPACLAAVLEGKSGLPKSFLLPPGLATNHSALDVHRWLRRRREEGRVPVETRVVVRVLSPAETVARSVDQSSAATWPLEDRSETAIARVLEGGHHVRDTRLPSLFPNLPGFPRLNSPKPARDKAR